MRVCEQGCLDSSYQTHTFSKTKEKKWSYIYFQKEKKRKEKKRKEQRSELCYSVMLRPTIDGKHAQ
jgi:hypothetical protein